VAFSILPTSDPHQAVRIRRSAFAGSVSLAYLFVLWVYYTQGWVAQETLIEASALVLSLVVAFYCAFRFGLNLRARDPSLTSAQILSAVFTMLYVLYQARGTREVFGLFLFLAFMFGMLRLSARELLILAAISLAGNAAVIALRLQNDDPSDLIKGDLLHLLVLAVTMPWFIRLGSYIRRLRANLANVSIKLEDIEEQARRDELTGVFNRRVLMAALTAEKNRCDRTGEVFCVCIIDVDFFKRVNDEIGHLAGDEVLRRLAQVVQQDLRAMDVFGRYGGEEFMQILPHTRMDGALARADRVRMQARALDLSDFAQACSISVSIGVAQYRSGESVMETLSRADAALYDAKRAGRNRVIAESAEAST
jgi:diguanylate cyclase (GGDEF)-like protein